MKYVIRPSERAKKLAEGMSFREALNQVSCPLLNFAPLESYGAAHLPWGAPEDTVTRATQLKAQCKVPPFFTADLECGPGHILRGFTRFPDLMGLGANDSEELAYETGKATALEGASVGLNWALAPCTDIAVNPDSPVVSTRSAGRTPERVIRTCRGYLRGLQDHGMIATLKHFPGDGYTTYDQHLTTAVNPLSKAQWRKGPGRVYRELIRAGARSVMVGHIALPAFDRKDPVRGLHPPATISKRLVTDLLKEELGFGGLIVSDAMGMCGVAGFTNLYEAYARFLEAGGDCILFPRVDDERYYTEMRRFVKEGLLKESTLYDRAVRVIAAKEDLGLLDGAKEARSFDREPVRLAEARSGQVHLRSVQRAILSEGIAMTAFNREAHAQLARRVSDGAAVLVRDRSRLIPIKLTKKSRVLHVVLAPNYTYQKGIYDALTSALGARCEVEEKLDPGPQQLYRLASSGRFDLIVCSVGASHSWATSVARFHGPMCRNMMDGWMRLGTPAVFVCHFHPFVHLEYEAAMDCVINTFRSIECTGERVVRGLTGEAPFTGTF